MATTILVALISLAGTALGTYGGIRQANKLTNYRLKQLEAKVDKHNTVIDRMYAAEKRLDVADEKIKVANNRIGDLEDWQRREDGV